MKVLYVAMANDYGRPERGPSFEDMNFRSALDGMGHDVIMFDFMERERVAGRAAMRRELIEAAAAARPDVVFLCLFTDQIDVDTLRRLRDAAEAPTVNWFCDDHWRFEDFTARYAPALDWSVTTDEDSLPKYAEIGVDRVILSQWACNRYAYRPDGDAGVDATSVTFVGQAHGDRPETIAALRRAGFPVECWGLGWPNGRLEHSEMVRVFSTSAINLNLSNSSSPESPWVSRLRRLARRPVPVPRPPQIKGRTFEIPGCGGFQLVSDVPHLEKYFVPGSEIAVYRDDAELIDQVRYWLGHPDERVAVARAGYERVLREHTYDHRFAVIFERMRIDVR